jgi:hypothetical protein
MAFDPFVVLLGEDSADEAGDGVAVGEDPDVGAAADLVVEPLGRVVRTRSGDVRYRNGGPPFADDLARTAAHPAAIPMCPL